MATVPANIPYDDRDGFIWMDGKTVPWREAKVHFLTHALHYGSGVFEGIRAYNGKPFKLREHCERLIEGCKIMDMACPYAADDIAAACLETLRVNNVVNGYIRPLAWRGAEQMGVAAQQTKTHVGVAAWEWGNYFAGDAQDKGIALQTSRWRRPPPDAAPVHAKACGLYMICTLSKHAAEKAGFTDALMLDYRGRVAELTGANFFMVVNGELHTPEADCFLNGITRRTVMELARENGLKVVERAILPEELKTAQECFATGTAAEITPIGRIDGISYAVGPVTRLLRDAYGKRVRA
ncbi:MAG: branched-chain amino acid aminotransferase [Alphaproteobacteria bacterium]|nr:branched-chain amino acid aminotransferase [Alphaproteobacteria bacterium]MDE2335891.1 branched-chain amino acid aminotransferase [Alphaproteobacteria bacterium]